METKSDKRRLAELIESLEQKLLDGNPVAAKELLDQQLGGAQDDLSLCIETAESLFRHGLLLDAEQWSDVAFSKLESSEAPHRYDRCDLLWLRADIAWQRGAMAHAAERYKLVRDTCGPSEHAEALRSIAQGLAYFAQGRHSEASSLADRALELGSHLMQVRFAVGYLRLNDRLSSDRDLLSELAELPTRDDPEIAAYVEEARMIMGSKYDPKRSGFDEQVARMDFKKALRFVSGVVACLSHGGDAQHWQTSSSETASGPFPRSVPGATRAQGSARNSPSNQVVARRVNPFDFMNICPFAA